MLRKILQKILKNLARQVINKYRPQIIGITGSVGKTTAKEATIKVLSAKYRVRGNIKNYNNEIGLPLTILGLESAGKSLVGWLKIFIKSYQLILSRQNDYPEFLVLEMGVDHPGDIDYLLSVVGPTSGIVTTIGQAHLEFFGTPEAIATEKGKLVAYLPADGFAVLNIDDKRVAAMAANSKASIVSYGFDSKAEVRASDLSFNYEQVSKLSPDSLPGLIFKLNYQGSIVPVAMPAVISEAAVYSALAAAAIGLKYGLSLLDVAEALRGFRPPKGRLNALPGSQGRIILDDTYNASPTSVMAALNILGRLPVENKKQRVAILGDMLELGSESPAEHRCLGQVIAKLPIGQLILVGPLARLIGKEAQAQGWKGEISLFDNSLEAAKEVETIVPVAATVLLKGSQGMRIEKITKVLLNDQNRAGEWLVRQDGAWLDS
ncbi:MAG TPA: Mur ligase family protein [bacterium]|nr:Mur ligase family protein [bacterium]